MELYKMKYECFGCSACKHICPKKSIKMVPDNEGFLYPDIDQNTCVDCGMCLKVCPMKSSLIKPSNLEDEIYEQKYYAAKNKDKIVINSSSSGGVFTALSDFVLRKKGAIYGVKFTSGFKVVHDRATSTQDRDTYKGSKYIQSDMNDIYNMVEKDLNSNIYVMFTGTPCQNAGLLSYLKLKNTNQEKLFTCDFVCHGTSSPLIWNNYVSYLEKKYKDKLIEFSFRSKKNGWENFELSATFTNGNYDNVYNKKFSFLKLYNSLFITRPSCFYCKYTSYNRVSDITIADYWNIKYVIPDFYDDLGVSLMMINSKKGNKWFDEISDLIDYKMSNKKDVWQPHLEYTVSMPKCREKFWYDYRNHGFDFSIRKYGGGTLLSKLIRIFTPIIKKTGLYSVAGKLYNKIINKSNNWERKDIESLK